MIELSFLDRNTFSFCIILKCHAKSTAKFPANYSLGHVNWWLPHRSIFPKFNRKILRELPKKAWFGLFRRLLTLSFGHDSPAPFCMLVLHSNIIGCVLQKPATADKILANSLSVYIKLNWLSSVQSFAAETYFIDYQRIFRNEHYTQVVETVY